MTWPWDAEQVFLHDHAEDEDCNPRCVEVPLQKADYDG